MSAANVPDWVVISAVRYCLGRKTYVVSECCDWLVANWHALPEAVRAVIRRDLDREFAEDDRQRADPVCIPSYYPLGMDMDRREWERVRHLWAEPEGVK